MKAKRRLSVLVLLTVMVAMLALPMSAYAAVKINKTKATIDVGKTVTLKVTGAKKGTKIKWASNKKEVASVSSKGVVKGVKAGTAKITATVAKKKYTCTVTVKAAGSKSDLTTIKEVLIDPYYLEDGRLYVGDTLTLTASSHDPITWTSNNPSIATVDANGVVTGLKKGKVKITAKSTKDKTLFDSAYITVMDGRELKRENYSNYLNFELKTVPVLIYNRGRYHFDNGQYVLGDWVWERDTTTGLYRWVNKGDKREVEKFYIQYYIALDAASLSRNIDFDRTGFTVNTSYKIAPQTIISVNKKNWNTPSFAVAGTRKKREAVASGIFDFTEFKNGVLTYYSGDPGAGAPASIFQPYEMQTVYEYVFPDEFVQTPLYAADYGDPSIVRSREAADKVNTEYLVQNLIDTTTFSIYDVTGTLYTK